MAQVNRSYVIFYHLLLYQLLWVLSVCTFLNLFKIDDDKGSKMGVNNPVFTLHSVSSGNGPASLKSFTIPLKASKLNLEEILGTEEHIKHEHTDVVGRI